MMLPPDFIDNIQNTFGEAGKAFLANLPALINEASQRWGLSEINPVENLSYNFVAFALSGVSDSERSRSALRRPSTTLPAGRSAQREEVVLKIGVPNRELISEIAALRLFNGEGAVRLLEADESRCMFLLERVTPGKMLSTLEDDEQATRIAADVMLKLWRPVNLESDGSPSELQELAPALHSLIKLSDWFEGFQRLRAQYDGGTGPLDKKLVEKAEGIAKEFFAEDYTPTLIHGDFHHFNVLSSTRGWLAIDPKGVIGPAAYEVGPLLLNPWIEPLNESRFKVQTKRRIQILSERLGLERKRIRNWGFAHAVLSAFWSLEDGADPSYAIQCAELL